MEMVAIVVKIWKKFRIYSICYHVPVLFVMMLSHLFSVFKTALAVLASNLLSQIDLHQFIHTFVGQPNGTEHFQPQTILHFAAKMLIQIASIVMAKSAPLIIDGRKNVVLMGFFVMLVQSLK